MSRCRGADQARLHRLHPGPDRGYVTKAQLKPGDAMLNSSFHVLLFEKWGRQRPHLPLGVRSRRLHNGAIHRVFALSLLVGLRHVQAVPLPRTRLSSAVEAPPALQAGRMMAGHEDEVVAERRIQE